MKTEDRTGLQGSHGTNRNFQTELAEVMTAVFRSGSKTSIYPLWYPPLRVSVINNGCMLCIQIPLVLGNF